MVQHNPEATQAKDLLQLLNQGMSGRVNYTMYHATLGVTWMQAVDDSPMSSRCGKLALKRCSFLVRICLRVYVCVCRLVCLVCCVCLFLCVCVGLGGALYWSWSRWELVRA